jgi:hypothetical protein
VENALVRGYPSREGHIEMVILGCTTLRIALATVWSAPGRLLSLIA